MDETRAALLVLAVVLLGLAALLVAGIRRVPLGAVGVVISFGRSTERVRAPGYVWLIPWVQHLVCLFTRERQVDVPKSEYFTADRVRISFKATLRVRVADPVAAFNQGPGTYAPFQREGSSDASRGAEEANLPLTRLVQNSIRETVQALPLEQVMFGSASTQGLGSRIRFGLAKTAQRWGLDVVEVWLTDVDADDAAMKQAMQSEARQRLEAQGQIATFEGHVRKGAVFQQVAASVAESIRQQTGQAVDSGEVLQFLNSFYQNERALEIAAASASGHSELMHMFYMQQFGMPVPGPVALGGRPLGGRPPFALPGQGGGPSSDGTFIIGRDVINHGGVSQQHARLDVVGGRMTLTDLGSTNGTSINGQVLRRNEPMPLNAGDAVGLGRHVVMTASDLLAAMTRHRGGQAR